MMQTVRIALGFLEFCQSISIQLSFWQATGVLLECLEQLFAYFAAFLAEFVVHPESLTADVNPAVTLQVSQMPRHG